LGSHEIQDLTKPHIFDMFCPFCRDILAQGLKGEYDYLDGITITSFGLNGGWLYDNKNHDLYPRPLPEDKPNNRLEACRMLADWQLSKPVYQQFYNPEYKTKMIDALAKNWDIDGIILHYNRGCEGLSVGIAENRLGLLELKNKVMVYEGNMGDETEFDESATLKRLDIFLENLGLERPED